MKPLEDMTEPELKEILHRVATRIQETLPPGTGFVVLASSFGGKLAQYASNVRREDAMGWMVETVDRWRRGNFVPRVGE